jgi:hypothetical protein
MNGGGNGSLGHRAKAGLWAIYTRLPVVRELDSLRRMMQKEVIGLARTRELVETASLIQALETIRASDPRYKDPKRLLAFGAQFWSQNFEDGMIAEIFARISATTETFVEIGVGDGAENNTTALLSRGWKGWWIEGNPESCRTIRNRLARMPGLRSRLTLEEAFITSANAAALFQRTGIPSEPDLFSLDIDLNTYHIWAALPRFRPRAVVVEYNSTIPASQSWIHPYSPEGDWDGTRAYGASLKAFELLGRKFGYSLVGCDLLGINAFFVRNDLVADRFAEPFTAENHYEPPRHPLVHRWSHPSCLFGESHREAP